MLVKFPELCIKPLASFRHKILPIAAPREWDAGPHKSELLLVSPV